MNRLTTVRRIGAIALAMLLCLCAPVHAQKTKSGLTTEINTNWPDNVIGAITPSLLRSTTLDIVNSYYDLNGVTSLSCAAHLWISGLPTLSSIACTQPSISDLQGISANTVVGSVVGGVPIALSQTQLTAMLNLASASLQGALPAWPNTTTTFFRGDGSYANVGTLALTGTLQAAQEPAHTGDCTNTAGSLALTCLSTNGTAFTAAATAANGQLPATATNDNAASSKVGEYIQSTVASGSAISLTTATSTNLTSIALTGGDWDVWCTSNFTGTGTAVSLLRASINTATPTENITAGNFVANASSTNLSTSDVGMGSLQVRASLAGSTTYSCNVRCTFGSGTCNVYGQLQARRRR